MSGPGVDHEHAAPDKSARTAEPATVATASCVASVLALQRTAGNRAVARAVSETRVLARNGDGTATATPPKKKPSYHEVRVGGNRVSVRSEAEKTEAERIITKLSAVHGIEVNSSAVVEAVKAGYPHAPRSVKRKLMTRHWKLYELQAVEKAADAFAPILGKARASSTRASEPQEVTKAGKVNYSIDVDTSKGKIDKDTTGEYFEDRTALGLFMGAEKWGGYFGSDYKKQRIQTAAHEMAHGLVKYALPGFIAETGYWQDAYTPSGAPNAEAPPTGYGETSAEEDMCESFGLYVADKTRLKNGDGSADGTPGNPCPKRFAYVEDVIKAWTPTPSASTTGATSAQVTQ
jgi:hypothetical protein